MFGLFQYRCLVTEDAVWLDEVCGFEYLAAIIALISACPLGVAVGAFSLYETVRQKSLVVFAVWQNYALAVDVAVLFDFAVGLLNKFLVDPAFRSSVIVKLNVEGFEEVLDELVVPVG